MLLLLTVATSISNAQNIPSSLFPKYNQIAGWSLKTPVVNYQANKLFDYMDGAAEIPKSYNFRSLGSAKYQKGGTTLEVAVFDMGTAADAYGYYSARVFLEHSPRSKERIVALDHPAHIYSTVGVLTLWKDHYTVILQPDDGKPDDASLLQFAKFVSSHIAGKGVDPALLARLPKADQIANSARYIHGKAAFDATVMFTAKDVFGMSNGPTAVAAEYTIDGSASSLAIINYATSEAAKSAMLNLQKLMAETKAAPGKDPAIGAHIYFSTGRAKGVGVAVSGTYLLLTVGSKAITSADAGIKRLLKVMH